MQKQTVDYGKVAVFLGGHSAEREISLNSGQAVLAALLRQNIDAVAIDPQQNLLEQIQQHKPNRVFIALHGRGGEDGLIQGFLDTLGLPYTGSGVLGSAIGMDKWRCKQIWQSMGLPTPKAMMIDERTDLTEVLQSLGLPLMIKPPHEGSSVGMSRVDKAHDLPAALAVARAHDAVILAEQFIHGAEYTASLLQTRALPLIRLQTPHSFYDYQAKYHDKTTQYHCPCGLPVALETSLQTMAQQAFVAVGGHGWGRVDFMLDEQQQPWLLEINTSPGMTDHSLVPMAAKAVGLDFDALVLQILANTL
jgi:D-alanine-D-alanine ligase